MLSYEIDMIKIPLVVIFAPTACGKTALCAYIFGAKSSLFRLRSKGEIISADSMAVYRELNIGTAKPSENLQKELPHHLIDVCSIQEQFDASRFIEEGDKAALDIFSRGKIPLVVGGSGFYIRSFLLGLPPTPPSDSALRENLKRRVETEGKEVLYAELCKIDEQSAAKIHRNDIFRICRALEVFYLTGRKRSSFTQSNTIREKYSPEVFILTRERDDLYKRIDERVEEMFSAGLAGEVTELLKAGHTAQEAGMKAIGYSEFATRWQGRDFSENEIAQIKAEIKHNSKKYAKKQYTFMTGIPNAKIFDANDIEKIAKNVCNLLDVQGKSSDN